MTISGPQSSPVISLSPSVSDGLLIQGVTDCTIKVLGVTGGQRAVIEVSDCHHLRIEGGVYSNPSGKKDSSGNGPHGVMVVDSTHVKFVGPEVVRNPFNFEVGYEVYMSRWVEFWNPVLRGRCDRRAVADGATVDVGSTDVRWVNPQFDCGGGPAGIVFAFGDGEIKGGKITGCKNKQVISVSSYYKLSDRKVPGKWENCKENDPDAESVGPVLISSGWNVKQVYEGPKGIVHYV